MSEQCLIGHVSYAVHNGDWRDNVSYCTPLRRHADLFSFQLLATKLLSAPFVAKL